MVAGRGVEIEKMRGQDREMKGRDRETGGRNNITLNAELRGV